MILSIGQASYFGTAPTMALLKAQRRFGTYLTWQLVQLAVAAAAFGWYADHGGAVAVASASAVIWTVGVMTAAIAASGRGRERLAAAWSFIHPWLIVGPIACLLWWGAERLAVLGQPGRVLSLLVLGPAAVLLVLAALPLFAPAAWAEVQPVLRKVVRRIPGPFLQGSWRGDV
jgi:hypothetical protein